MLTIDSDVFPDSRRRAAEMAAKDEGWQMAGGWSRDGAVQDQIDASVEDAVRAARERLPKGEGATRCDECEAAIPAARRAAVPGVRLCVACQSESDERSGTGAGFNRRGSKDSQLR